MKLRWFVLTVLVGCGLSRTHDATACVGGAARAPVAQLLPNHPNPFNPNTTIRFVLPSQTRVTITVHDISGRVVATLLDEVRAPGSHQVTWNADGMASGVYFAKLRAGSREVSRKMVLVK